MDLPAIEPVLAAPVVGTIIGALIAAAASIGVVMLTRPKTRADIHSQVNQSFKLLTDELQEERALQNKEIRELRDHNEVLRVAAEQLRGEVIHFKSLSEYRDKEIARLRRRLAEFHKGA